MIISGCATTSERLHSSAKSGEYANVEILVEKGVDVNAQDNDGDTALMIAVREGHTEVVKLLIEVGADVNAQDSDGDTALMTASRGGYLDVVQLLIDAGVDVNAKNDSGETALSLVESYLHKKEEYGKKYGLHKHEIYEEGYDEILWLLIEAGAK